MVVLERLEVLSNIGKVMVLTFSDSEENIMNKILSAVEGEMTMEYIQNPNPDIFTFPGLEIHIHEQTVYHNGTLIPMTHHEFFTLLHLAQHPSWVLSQSAIYEAVWKEPGDKCGSAVTNVVSQIRRKIGDGYIETVVGSGYRFAG